MKKQILDIINELTLYSSYYRSIITEYGMTNLPAEMINGEIIAARKYQILDNRTSPVQAESLYTHHFFCNRCKRELEVLWSYDDMQKKERILSRNRKLWYNISYADKYCRNHRPGKGKNIFRILDDIYISPHNNFISFSNDYEKKIDMEKYLHYMNIFQPIWLCFDDILFREFNNYINNYHLVYPHSIKFVEIRSSNVSIIHEFGELPFAYAYVLYDNVISEFAYECPKHYFHILDDIVYVEYLPSERNDYAYVTNLCNKVFPIIRYSISLPQRIKDCVCECGAIGDILNI